MIVLPMSRGARNNGRRRSRMSSRSVNSRGWIFRSREKDVMRILIKVDTVGL